MSDLVDLSQHRLTKAVGAYADAMGGIVSGMRGRFAQNGKFMPFAVTYVDSGFEARYAPVFYVDVCATPQPPRSPARGLLRDLPGYAYHKGDRWTGPWARLTGAEYQEVRRLFASCELGAYQPSKLGFGSTYHDAFDARGIGFHISVAGYDSTIPGKYAHEPFSHQDHIIDDDDDMAEVSQMMAFIARSRISIV